MTSVAGRSILTVAQMRGAEQALIEAGTSVEALMDIAGRGAGEWVWRLSGGRPVTVLCGPGNNGGDGWVIAEFIRALGGDVAVISPKEPGTAAARNARSLYRGAVIDAATPRHGEVFVDCLFGSGLTRALPGEWADLIARLARHHHASVAIDLPSGVESDSGAVLNDVLPRYDLTVALGAWKFAHWTMPAMAAMGQRRLVGIGCADFPGAARLLARPRIGAPAVDAHKYTRGLVAVVAGAMPGAAALAAEAAARSGAGYLRLLGEGSTGLLSHAIVRRDGLDFDRCKAVLIGPGLGRDVVAWERLTDALASNIPVVADADALWLLAEMGIGTLPAPAITTPHAGEFMHIYGDENGNKIDCTRSAAARVGSVVVHKGPDTVIAAPDGRVAIAVSTSTWLSTAGTGDVLAGLCAARLAAVGDPFRAACEAVWLHGEAALRAGPSFVADDLIAQIPASIGSCL